MREPRLGDDIDDFCVRCKRIMNHAIVSVVNGEPAKVRCRTCHNDHDYRHEQPPPPKVDARKQALFNEALKKINPAATTEGETAPEVELDAEDLTVEEVAVEDREADGEPVASEPAEEEPKPRPSKAAAKTAPKAKAAKAKSDAKGRKSAK